MVPGMSSPALILAPCSAASPAVARCAALANPDLLGGEPPDWIHLLPAGTIDTVDSRGPYRVAEPDALIAASFAASDRLPLDVNHAIDLAASRGEESPARGWIVELQSRADGIWGRVEWTDAGRQLVLDRSYRWISPVIAHTADKTVVGVLRASLVNNPNLRGLTALNHPQDDSMDFLTRLRQALGLRPDADEAAVLATLSGGISLNAVARAASVAEGSASAVVLQAVSTHAAHAAQMPAIAKAAGLAEGASGEAVLQAVRALADPARTVPAATVTALQAEIAALRHERAREIAEAFVDGAIRDRRIAAPAQMREHYIARHMVDPVAVEKEINAMPPLYGPSVASAGPPGTSGEALDPTDGVVVAMMGLDPAAYAANRKKLTEGAL